MLAPTLRGAGRILPFALFLAPLLSILGLEPGCKSSVRTVKGGSLGSQAPDPLRATAIEPVPGVIEVGPLAVLRVTFSEEVDPASLGPAPLIVVELASASEAPGTTTLEDAGKALAFRAAGGLLPDARYSLQVSSGLRSLAGGAYIPGPAPGAPVFPAFFETFAESPVMPGSLTFLEATSSSLSFEWSAASDNSSPDGSALVYAVHVGLASQPLDVNGTPDLQTPAGATTALVTRLEAGLEYRAAIRARDPAGNLSAASNEVIARTATTEDPEPPEFAGVVRVEATSPTSLRAIWEAGRDRPDPAAPLLYNVFVALDSGQQDFGIPAKSSAPGATEVEIDGLPPDTPHFVVVRAMDPSGNEDANTVEASATTLISYEVNVVRVLKVAGRCSRGGCHSALSSRGGLDLETYDGLIQGGDSQPPDFPQFPRTVEPGDGKGSGILWRTDRANPNYGKNCTNPPCALMPQGGRALSVAELSTLERWIDQGALPN